MTAFRRMIFVLALAPFVILLFLGVILAAFLSMMPHV